MDVIKPALPCTPSLFKLKKLRVIKYSSVSSSSYITRVFIKTEMLLKSKSVCSGSKQLVRSRSSDNLPTSQSQVNIQMMSHTLTIREVGITPATEDLHGKVGDDPNLMNCFYSSLPFSLFPSKHFSRLLGGDFWGLLFHFSAFLSFTTKDS